ncbi:unnamed protein product [Ceutorhynchus assimilis]|uniref:Adenosine deaminase n=1 Tax=Ceutorhynchus assimilis TaxID=467358 RepID=A0A9N9QHS7_9CUCU|nr:unnamed protein product [Ceutorhynchus assimilis]
MCFSSNYKVLVALICIVSMLKNTCQGADEYLEARCKLLRDDEGEFRGSKLNLSESEGKVNEYLVSLKLKELEESYGNFSAYLPERNFLDAKEDIEQSKVFQFIQKIPKGTSLHTHLLAAVNVDYIIQNFTYMENLYGCTNFFNIFKLKFLENSKQDLNCSWKSLKTYRQENPNFDAFLKNCLALGKEAVNQTRNEVWSEFKNTFSSLYDFASHRPVFKLYVKQLLEELWVDKVIYTELRGTFMPLYDLNGTTYNTKMFLDTLIEAVDDFKTSHPDFLGIKYILNLYRGVDNNTLKSTLEELIYYKSLYPDLIAGFDFIGLEEEGKNLVDFHEELLKVSKDLQFFFHAGETNQFGHTDLNLADAILLNATRIGHGFALVKHPQLLEEAGKRDIAVELCPISNQVLKLNKDPRNHPATILLAKGHPVVICNDDPSVWGATGLSYDWYVTFMSMTWQNHGLKILKQFAIDSITYSAMSETEKIEAFEVWTRMWDEFIEEVICRNKL